MYLTYEEYTQFGGEVAETDFPNLERKAERKLDSFTQDRVKTATIVIDEVKELLTEFVNMLNLANKSGNQVSSYSNGVESFGYEIESSDNLNQKMFSLAVEYLPLTLISGVASGVIDDELE